MRGGGRHGNKPRDVSPVASRRLAGIRPLFDISSRLRCKRSLRLGGSGANRNFDVRRADTEMQRNAGFGFVNRQWVNGGLRQLR